MREKSLEMVELLVSPFQKMIDSIAMSEAGVAGVLPDEQLTPPLIALRDVIRAKLTEERAGYEDGAARVIESYLTENEVDQILAFNKSAVGQKLLGCHMQMQRDFMNMTAEWRYKALEAHQEEMKKILCVVEPAPAPIPEASTEKVESDGWEEITAHPDGT
jgi:hypothetical protein